MEFTLIASTQQSLNDRFSSKINASPLSFSLPLMPITLYGKYFRIPFGVALPFILNLIFNFAFTPIQFGLKNNLLAGVDIILVLGTLIWGMVAIYPHKKWVTYIQIPYLLWVSFATVLQFTVTYLNF